MSSHIMVNNILDERFAEDEPCKKYVTVNDLYGEIKTLEVVVNPKKVLTVRNSPDHNVNFVLLSIDIDSIGDNGPKHLEIQVKANDLIKAVENATNY